MADLDARTSAEIDRLAQLGNTLFDEQGDWKRALNTWRSALSHVPQPHSDWVESLWLYASIGDAYREAVDLTSALEAYRAAYSAPEGHIHPYVLLQLGKTLSDLGQWRDARDFLLRAYMLEGAEMFEDEDAAYLRKLEDDPEIKL